AGVVCRPAPPGSGWETPSGRTAESVGTGQKNGIVMRGRKSGDGVVRVIVSVSPDARSPEMWSVFPSRNASSPSMSETKYGPGAWSPIAGDSARSIEKRNVSAVTGWLEGGENRNPSRIVNRYTLPSTSTLLATSGCSVAPPGPSASAYPNSGAQVAY